MYAAGPGDVIGTYRYWREGRDDPGQVAMTYSGQFFDVCRELGASGYVIASHPRREVVKDGTFRVEHKRIPFAKSIGLLYHLGQVLSGLQMIVSALRFRAEALVICDGTCHWFPLRMLPRLGIAVIPTIHCMLWRKCAPPPGRGQRILRRIDRPFWRRSAAVVLAASRDIIQQIDELAGAERRPVVEFLPTYRREAFPDTCDPPERRPFRVLFAGRIERYKGVFDLLEIAMRLAAAGRTDIEFDLCGSGSALPELIEHVEKSGLPGRFRLHGHCDQSAMREMFRLCHALIVPTTTDFAEGFNQVVAEGVLAGRPVITSNVCPALDYVRDAVLEVPPDDVSAYEQAILRLCDDHELYERKRQACLALKDQFYDYTRGWAAALRDALRACGFEFPSHSKLNPHPTLPRRTGGGSEVSRSPTRKIT